MLLEPRAFLSDARGLNCTLAGKLDVELPSVLLVRFTDNELLRFELGKHFRHGGGAYAGTLEQFALRDVSVAFGKRTEYESLAAATSFMHV